MWSHTCAVALVAVLGLAGCTGDAIGSEDSGYAARVQQETDRAAEQFLPAAVSELGVQVAIGRADFLECDVRGWRYNADSDLFGSSADAADVPAKLQALMEEQGLTVEQRADGSVVGRSGELSLLVGEPVGPPARRFRHVSLTHACKAYSDADTDVARASNGTDYTAYVPASAIYRP